MSKEITLNGVARDNGRVINNGPRDLGTNKKGRIGSTQGWTPGTSYRDTGSQSQWRDQQDSGQRYQDWSQQPQTTQGGWQAPQRGYQQQQQSQQQQLPTLPAPVYPPGMQPMNVPPPPGLGPTSVQQSWQGVTSQTQQMQGSVADRQQSPFGLQSQQPTGRRYQ